MSEIPLSDIPALLLRTLPETADFIAQKYEMSAEAAVLTEEMTADLYEVLAECLTAPVLMPQLKSATPDTELLARCWDFVERLTAHSLESVRGAAYFEVLEQLLDADGLVEAAWPYMGERTRARTLTMLDFYGVRLPGIDGR
ncbi:hypothetical protein [Streptomyces asoensis]|uniref:Uncharacterized protein n=1 Tax=Streptomyces asoensis TaxID=249586 RepID=A0ABQ3RVD2_9ACTN|nr:hypothetical protein [Streptomyces asoensis]GGQ93175.1 hypothetical protein GCM10010496_67580 [Streptomyces asoensis]GHI59803.1 hypothetical protein Saso_14530 [Streptomyces asoensis]